MMAGVVRGVEGEAARRDGEGLVQWVPLVVYKVESLTLLSTGFQLWKLNTVVIPYRWV